MPAKPKHTRTPSGRHPLQPKLAGRALPTNAALPSRTTKVSEKLVLLPETANNDDDLEEKADFDEDNETGPERDDEAAQRASGRGKSYAERLTKARRTEKNLARVTAYCTAQAYKLTSTAKFLREQHGAKAKLYDDCLYVVYHLPLMPGSDGYRVRSSPVLKNPGGKAVLDLEIDRNERRDYGPGFFDEDERYSIRGEGDGDQNRGRSVSEHSGNSDDRASRPDFIANGARRHSDSEFSTSPSGGLGPDALSFAEMYIFSYGTVVFWNFTESQEKDILADLTFFQPPAPAKPLRLKSSAVGASMNSAVHSMYSPGNGAATKPKVLSNTLVVAPMSEDDFETEEFHFEYDVTQPRPRIFNDMITLRSGDHMIKLTLSHAIAQSTKLSAFEQQMANQMNEAQHVPKRLALTGTLGMKRDEVFKILGALFKSRVDVNLSSNVLDTPDFFWSSEPPLHPLYASMRTYLEIDPRVKTLNERCRVFLDLASILSDSIADTKMSLLTWIIIVLILISIAVTCTEVVMRFAILSKEKAGKQGQELVRILMENGTRYIMANGTRFVEIPLAGGNALLAGAPLAGTEL